MTMMIIICVIHDSFIPTSLSVNYFVCMIFYMYELAHLHFKVKNICEVLEYGLIQSSFTIHNS
jgi:hypothetical protein